MNPEQNQRQCTACGEPETLFILTVIKDRVPRPLCTDCLLKEHRDLFCPVCLNVFAAVPPQEPTTICLVCSSTAHRHCSPPSPSSSNADYHSFTCPPCLSPNFAFFPKSRDNDGAGTVLDMKTSKALAAAAEIAVASAKSAVDQLEEEVVNKSTEAAEAKKKAGEALVYLENVTQKAAAEKINPKKRKNM